MNRAPGNPTPLPEGFDERTRLAAGADGRITAAHPDHPPVFVNPYFPPTPDEALKLVGGLRPGTICYADPIAAAIDNYMKMEAQARAWDAFLADPRVSDSERAVLQSFLAQAKIELAKRD